MGLFDFFKETIGIDPGSHHLRIIRNGEMVFDELSQISFDRKTKIVTGLGSSAKSSESEVIIRPIDNSIADFLGFEMLLRGAMKKAIYSNSPFSKSYIMYFCIPSGATEGEKRVYRDSAEHAGAIEVYMIRQCFCAALGLNVLFEKRHFILIDFGSSKIEMTVFVESQPISAGVVKMGTSRIFRFLKNFFRRKYDISLADSEIESLLAEMHRNTDEIKVMYRTIEASEIHLNLSNVFALINDELTETFDRASDNPGVEKALMAGIFFTGGGSTIPLFREKINFGKKPIITLSQNPLLDNIIGLRKIIAEKDQYQKYIMV